MPDLKLEKLKEFKPNKKFYVGIDSDGCAFDSMEIKHKECFIPAIIQKWKLQPIAKYARAVSEFVNLYSKWRGVNRFPALVMTFDLLKEWPEPMNRNPQIPEIPAFREWVRTETALSNTSLKQKIKETNHPDFQHALEWSMEVNQRVEALVSGVPPFPRVAEVLQKLSEVADIVVVSGTPTEALEREWEEHHIRQFVRLVCGQEIGSKKEILSITSQSYSKDHVIMIGDADGDRQAAKFSNLLFYPINPSKEENSWERFYKEGMDKFLKGKYAGPYEARVTEEFKKFLPEIPPWKN